MERREFLALPATLAAGGLAAAQPQAPWHQRVRRIGQLNANERDPVDLDVKAWADYWASLKVDAVLVSVTGIVAFYPTKLPNFRRAAFLGDRDLFGDCCQAAKQRGMRVIARFSPDLTWEEFLKVHPEWFVRDSQGRPSPQADAPGLLRTCQYSTYFGEQIPAIMREVNALYDIDGIYTNGWPSLGRPTVCYCDQCKKLPKPDTQEFNEAYVERVVELWSKYTGIAREKRPDNIYFANLGGGIRPFHNLKRLAEVAEWFNCDHQGRGASGNEPAWSCAQQGRVAQSVMKGKTITLATGAWSTTTPRYRNVAKSPAEDALWLTQTVASGMVPWYHWLGGQTGMGEDRRWMEPGRSFYQWLAKHERHFFNKRSIANLGVVFAQRTHAYYRPPGGGGQARVDATDALQGLYYTLLEGRFLFDFVHEDDLGPETLKKYRALLLPNVALLSDQQCSQLQAYVVAGGSLLATFETGLYDERGRARPDFGLGGLFGIQRAGDRQGPNGNAPFARIEKPHEILRSFQNTNWIAGAEYWLPVKAAGQPVLTVVPAYTAYPPERVYTTTPRSEHPAIVLSEKGTSRLVYFPGSVDATAWQTGHTDLSTLLENAVRWVSGGQAPVTVSGDGVAELFAWETEPGYAVHILNYNNPSLHRGWFRRHYPIGAQRVRFEVPVGKRITRVELLRAEKTVPFERRGNAVEFVIPTVNDYEVAAVVAG